MLCRRKNKTVELSDDKFKSCSGDLCGGWRFIYTNCDPRNFDCVGRSGAWLPVASVCSLGIYRPEAVLTAVPLEGGSSSSSSSVEQSSSSSEEDDVGYLTTEGDYDVATDAMESIIIESVPSLGLVQKQDKAEPVKTRRGLVGRLAGSVMGLFKRKG